MAEIVWSEPARSALDAIAEYIALDNPLAAQRFIQRLTHTVEQLAHFPKSGSRIPEAPKNSARQLVIRPCRVFYRIDDDTVTILNVLRNEMLFHRHLLS
jgi:toxin ParE1/3/4